MPLRNKRANEHPYTIHCHVAFASSTHCHIATVLYPDKISEAFMAGALSVTGDSDIKNGELEGWIHSGSTFCAFLFGTVSMWWYAWRDKGVTNTACSQSFALSLFTVTLLTLLLFLVLALRKVPLVKQQVTDEWQELIKPTPNTNPITQGASAALNNNQQLQNDGQQDHLKQANQGLGLTERILIFLYIQWLLNLSWMCIWDRS